MENQIFWKRIEEEDAVVLRTLNNMLEFTTFFLKHKSNFLIESAENVRSPHE